MRAMNDTISIFSTLAFRNKRILSLSKKLFQTLFQWNTVFLDLVLPKYSVFRRYSTKSDFRRYSQKNVILGVIPQKNVILGVIPQKIVNSDVILSKISDFRRYSSGIRCF